MNNGGNCQFAVAVLLFFCTSNVLSEARPLSSCESSHGASGHLQTPVRVLIVPLLSGDPETQKGGRWAEQPARTIATFYRDRFHAHVRQLHNVWSWEDYYQQVGQLVRQSTRFDRVIFIGHGGFDGPVLRNNVFLQDVKTTGGNTQLLQQSEAQPGLLNVLSVNYDSEKNPTFTDYVATHRQELAHLGHDEIWQRLKGLERRLQPLDNACFDRYCSADKLASARPETRPNKLALCETVCREQLFRLKSSVEISPERFWLFANSLNALVSPRGLVFLGACNPGSKAPKTEFKPVDTDLLINSTLAGGPYQSYVHLVSSATARAAAGPIGQSSADDIVNRIILFEGNRPQRFLCVVAPRRIKTRQ